LFVGYFASVQAKKSILEDVWLSKYGIVAYARTNIFVGSMYQFVLQWQEELSV